MAIAPEKKSNRTNFYKVEAAEGSYLSPAYSQPVLVELLSSVPMDSIARICDIGSGAGNNLPTLRRQFPSAHALAFDLSRNALARGRDAAPFAMAVQSDAAALPIGSDSIDLAVCTEVLEHVPDLQAAVDEIARVLRDGGYAVISSPNYRNPMGVRKWLQDWRMGDSYWDPWGGHPGFERLMTPSLVRKAVVRRFSICRVLGAGYLMGWIPLGYRRIGGLSDRHPMRWIGRLPVLQNLAINRYLLLQKRHNDHDCRPHL